ncbi:SMYD [Lepeophtheirus salmonis]|uniref:SMYD n=1 Tax=Lepeophtheirus salmonis TaxID=72036 RepID=A0A7R8CM96_LEPSM|nr:SMYD [Lepeophtheirus salmonis]CAF2864848.1 SMYD [Lepeophtheirus salmonis]
MNGQSCFICYQPSTLRCEKHGEDVVYFCSKAHNRKGNIIFEETPGLVGPNPIVETPICIACYTKVSPKNACSACRFPICQVSCSDHQTICPYLCRFGIEDLSINEICRSSILHSILVLKLLLSKETNPEVYNCLIHLMDHAKERMEDTEYKNGIRIPILVPLKKSLKMNEKHILQAMGIVEVNNYEIYNSTGSAGFRGLYCLTSLLSHDCVPNARPIISHKSPFKTIMMATRDIHAGEMVTINYVHTQKPTRIRQKTLKDNWYFVCSCKRCKDESEFELNPDGVKCDSCRKGQLNPCENNMYKCNKCDNKNDLNFVEHLMNKLERKKSEIDRNDINTYLKFYIQSTNILTENHYFLNSLRRWIIPLYCRPLASNPDVNPTFEMFKTKIQLCNDYLRSLDQIEPGLSKNRGKVLYEWAESSLKTVWRNA